MSNIVLPAYVSVRVAEIKVRLPEELMGWEERKVIASLAVVTREDGKLVMASNEKITLSEAVNLVARAVEPRVVETRWNFQGLDQGHYTLL